MSESLLNRIVNNDTKNQKEQAKQTSLLTDILAVQKGILKAEETSLKTEARQRQKTKRSSADRSPSSALKRKEKKQEEKESKGLLGKLLGLGGIGKIIGGSALLIAGLATAVGAAMALYFKNKKFRDAVNKATTVMWEFTRDNVLTPSWEWIKKKGPEAYKWLEREILKPSIIFLKNELGNFYKFITGNPQAKSGKDISTDAYRGLLGALNSGVAGASKRGASRKQLESISDRIIQQDIGFTPGLKGTPEYDAKAEKAEYAQKVAKLLEEKENMEVQLMSRKARKAAGAPWYVSQKEAWAKNETRQIEKLEENIGHKVTQIQREQEKTLRLLKIDLTGDTVIRRQKGGHIDVPGTGDGDKVPMMLPSGSFVMNRNASMMLQNGGMVPTLLEPGEKVFGPGQWGPMEQMMNSTFGRFQNGGEVPKAKEGDISRSGLMGTLIFKGGKWQPHTEGTAPSGTAPSGKDSKPVPSNQESDLQATGEATFAPLNNIRAGGKMTFIGDGSGFTGEVKLIDGNGQVVAALGGVSGTSRTAGASQEQRKNVSGTYNPLPDGKFPLEPGVAYHPGNELGNWSAWINNPGGQIGARGGLMVHNDLGSDGTAGCIGIEAGGTRASANSMKFAEVYDRVQPSDVEVNLSSSSGKSYTPGSSGGDDFFSQLGTGLGKLSPLLQAFANFGMKFSGLSAVPGALSQFFTGGDSPSSPGSGSGSAPEVTPGAKGLLDFIAHYESNGSYNKIFGGAEVAGLTDMTINQVVDYQKAFLKRTGAESAAIGRYQMMYPEEYADKAGVPRDAKFSEANQDKIAMAYLEEDGWSRYKSGQLSASKFADNVAGTWAALPTAGGASAHAGVGSNRSLVDRATYMKQIEAAKLQTGGIVNMSGNNTSSGHVMSKSQQAFAEQIASAVKPVVIPVPTGGGGDGGGGGGGGRGPDTSFPVLPAEDSSIVSMEYKYRITMGASV